MQSNKMLEAEKHNWEQEAYPLPIHNIFYGELEKDVFTALQDLLETDQWRTPGLEIHACDGVAWKIDYYSEEGEILRSMAIKK